MVDVRGDKTAQDSLQVYNTSILVLPQVPIILSVVKTDSFLSKLPTQRKLRPFESNNSEELKVKLKELVARITI